MPSKCNCQLKHPDKDHLSSLVISAEANPCPMRTGGTATHRATIKNQRSNNIYEVEITVRSRRQGVIFNYNNQAVTECTHKISAIASHSFDYREWTISENAANSASSTEDIYTAVVLYDETQQLGNTF